MSFKFNFGECNSSNNWVSFLSGIHSDSAVYLGSKPKTSNGETDYDQFRTTLKGKFFRFFDYNPIVRPRFSLFTDNSTHINIGNTYITGSKKTELSEEEKKEQERKKTMIAGFAIFAGATAYAAYLYNRFNKIEESFQAFNNIHTVIKHWPQNNIEKEILEVVVKHLELDARKKGIIKEEFYEMLTIVASAVTVIVGSILAADAAIAIGIAGVSVGSIAFIVSLIRNYMTIEPQNIEDHRGLYNKSFNLIERLRLNPSNQIGGKREAQIVPPPEYSAININNYSN